ncbi:Hypothetical_protein [Hexamita inflata]|uniref:Hypothetical_protein n=1 Tax=Hexamita inflata TaxID=28002 RepID=A0ABP1JFQ9_9EUKA
MLNLHNIINYVTVVSIFKNCQFKVQTSNVSFVPGLVTGRSGFKDFHSQFRGFGGLVTVVFNLRTEVQEQLIIVQEYLITYSNSHLGIKVTPFKVRMFSDHNLSSSEFKNMMVFPTCVKKLRLSLFIFQMNVHFMLLQATYKISKLQFASIYKQIF